MAETSDCTPAAAPRTAAAASPPLHALAAALAPRSHRHHELPKQPLPRLDAAAPAAAGPAAQGNVLTCSMPKQWCRSFWTSARVCGAMLDPHLRLQGVLLLLRRLHLLPPHVVALRRRCSRSLLLAVLPRRVAVRDGRNDRLVCCRGRSLCSSCCCRCSSCCRSCCASDCSSCCDCRSESSCSCQTASRSLRPTGNSIYTQLILIHSFDGRRFCDEGRA
jgi:hypothetical protein